jgi:hypothetical protein
VPTKPVSLSIPAAHAARTATAAAAGMTIFPSNQFDPPVTNTSHDDRFSVNLEDKDVGLAYFSARDGLFT